MQRKRSSEGEINNIYLLYKSFSLLLHDLQQEIYNGIWFSRNLF